MVSQLYVSVTIIVDQIRAAFQACYATIQRFGVFNTYICCGRCFHTFTSFLVSDSRQTACMRVNHLILCTCIRYQYVSLLFVHYSLPLGFFFRCDISVICPIIVLKLTITVFTSLPFLTL